MSRLCAGSDLAVLHHFQEGSKARKKSRSAMFGVVSLPKGQVLGRYDTRNHIRQRM